MRLNSAAMKAIRASGGIAPLARSLLPKGHRPADFTRMQSRISKWRHKGVPAKWVLAVEAATGVPRHQLAPHLYPRDKAAA